jgi:hypothetical protein
MSVRKLSVALDERIADRATRSAERLGLSFSAWLNRAAEKALAIEEGLAAVAEWEAEHGALTADELAEADAALDATARRRSRSREWTHLRHGGAARRRGRST